jgi:hypothetical protein
MQKGCILRLISMITESNVGPDLASGPQLTREMVRRSSVAKPMEDRLSGDPTSGLIRSFK